MVNIIMVKSAINGIYSIEKIKVRNGQLCKQFHINDTRGGGKYDS